MWTLRTMLVGLAILSAGCGAARSAPQATAPSPAPSQADRGKTRVEIDNQNFNDMTIYLIEPGTRVLLGSVTGLTKTTLTIPRGGVGGDWKVVLLADPVGGSSPIRTPSLLVAPGQSVFWTIGANSADSFASAG